MLLDLILRALFGSAYRLLFPTSADRRLHVRTDGRVATLTAHEALRLADSWRYVARRFDLVDTQRGVFEGSLFGVRARLESGLREARAYSATVTLDVPWRQVDAEALYERATEGAAMLVSVRGVGKKTKLTFAPGAAPDAVIATVEHALTLAGARPLDADRRRSA